MGHKTTDVVLRHYFRPGQEDFRVALEGAMPKLLTRGSVSGESEQPAAVKAAKEEMRELLGRVKPVARRERLLEVWARLGGFRVREGFGVGTGRGCAVLQARVVLAAARGLLRL